MSNVMQDPGHEARKIITSEIAQLVALYFVALERSLARLELSTQDAYAIALEGAMHYQDMLFGGDYV